MSVFISAIPVVRLHSSVIISSMNELYFKKRHNEARRVLSRIIFTSGSTLGLPDERYKSTASAVLLLIIPSEPVLPNSDVSPLIQPTTHGT